MTMPRTVLGGVLVSVGLLALGGVTPASAEEIAPAPPSAPESAPSPELEALLALSRADELARSTNQNPAQPRQITVSYKGKGGQFCLANLDGSFTQCVDNVPGKAGDSTPGATIQYNTDQVRLQAITKTDNQEIPSQFDVTSDKMRCDDVAQGGEQTRIECKPDNGPQQGFPQDDREVAPAPAPPREG